MATGNEAEDFLTAVRARRADAKKSTRSIRTPGNADLNLYGNADIAKKTVFCQGADGRPASWCWPMSPAAIALRADLADIVEDAE